MGAALRMCARCQWELTREVGWKRQSWRDDMHRGSSKGMLKEPDPEAEKIRRRKEAKRSKEYRERIASGDWKGVAKLFITTTASPPPSEECADCKRLNTPRGTVPLHVFVA